MTLQEFEQAAYRGTLQALAKVADAKGETWTQTQAAKLIGCTPRTLRNRREKGTGPVFEGKRIQAGDILRTLAAG